MVVSDWQTFHERIPPLGRACRKATPPGACCCSRGRLTSLLLTPTTLTSFRLSTLSTATPRSSFVTNERKQLVIIIREELGLSNSVLIPESTLQAFSGG